MSCQSMPAAEPAHDEPAEACHVARACSHWRNPVAHADELASHMDQQGNFFWSDGLREKDWPRDRPANPTAGLPALTFLARAVLQVGALLFPEWNDGDPALPQPEGSVAPSSGEPEDQLRFARETRQEALRTEAWRRVDEVRRVLVEAIESGRLTVWHRPKDEAGPARQSPADWWHADSYAHLFHQCEVVPGAPHARQYRYSDQRHYLFVETGQLRALLVGEPESPALPLAELPSGPVTTARVEEVIRSVVKQRKGVEPARRALKEQLSGNRLTRDRVRELHADIWLQVWRELPAPGANSREQS